MKKLIQKFKLITLAACIAFNFCYIKPAHSKTTIIGPSRPPIQVRPDPTPTIRLSEEQKSRMVRLKKISDEERARLIEEDKNKKNGKLPRREVKYKEPGVLKTLAGAATVVVVITAVMIGGILYVVTEEMK